MTRVFPGFPLELRKYGLEALDSLLEFVFACVDCVLWESEWASISKDAIEGPWSRERENWKKKKILEEKISMLWYHVKF